MTNEELVKLIQQKIDIKENMGRLYEQNKNFIYKLVKPYSKIVEIEDLMQEAYFGLYEAVKRFDIESEYKFLSYASYWILSKVSNYCKNNGRIKRLSAHMIEQISKYYKFIIEYEKINNEKPNDDETMQYLQVNKKQFADLKKFINEDSVKSLNMQIDEDFTLENTIADEHIIEEEICENMLHEQLKNELWYEVEKLPEQTSNIIKQKYKYNKQQKDIANKYDVSQQRISQIEYQGLKILSEKENLKELAKEYYYDTSMAYRGNFKSFKENGESVVERLVIKKIDNEKEILRKIEIITNKRNKILESLR